MNLIKRIVLVCAALETQTVVAVPLERRTQLAEPPNVKAEVVAGGPPLTPKP